MASLADPQIVEAARLIPVDHRSKIKPRFGYSSCKCGCRSMLPFFTNTACRETRSRRGETWLRLAEEKSLHEARTGGQSRCSELPTRKVLVKSKAGMR